ncbi:methionine--tRNA ligase [Curtanaerobium respiraculi]|uniref:methionine--tRNA ligase n=1 Tax=Curtanaerobium respiraculi TaxID=2949669 RepID=UPI003D185ADF
MESSNNVEWPHRAVVTAGMPYGNKPLHFGHVGGVFVPADCFARFLRDRIGADNVRFVSGTDCFGSPIDEGYRKLVEAGGFEGTIADYVQRNHDAQKATLDAYGISLDIYEGSGIGHAGEVHQAVTNEVLRRLHESGHLHKRETLQFYDPEAKTFLNGRQVVGRCPVQGCKSEKAYADECDLGHQYDPRDLISPRSSVTGSVPEMRPVQNWYFDLPDFADYLRDWVKLEERDPDVRAVVTETIEEFLVPPIIFVKNDLHDAYLGVRDRLPEHAFRPAEGGKQSFELEFPDIDARDDARDVLAAAGIRFRTGKALVPFRITGNISWGVKAPEMDGTSGLTVWCWPESLWAPISFTIAANDARGLPREEWRRFWCDDDAEVYQFIGQDNIYFYGVAQPALWAAMQEGGNRDLEPSGSDLRQTNLVANYHMLFGSKKASSSSECKPPTADELLDFYTVEQLRAHWLALGLDQRAVGFKPKAFEPDPAKRADARVSDPVLKEGALLTRVFNRLARSCLYEAKNNFDCFMPLGAVTPEVRDRALGTMSRYERFMHRVELHSIMSLMDDFIRYANKWWSDGIRRAQNDEDEALRRQVLVDSFYLLRIATLLMHPVVPQGTEKICDYLNFDFAEFFSWNYDFESMDELCGAAELGEGRHLVLELPPKADFFRPHPSQLKK